MKKTLKILLPLVFGVGVLFLFLRGFSEQQYQNVITSIRRADIRLIVLSVLLGLLSHIIRAVRWKYLLEPFAGKRPKTWNLIFAVGLSYLVNLGIPRSGEVARALTVAKYENLPFARVMGTVITERIVDTIILLLFVLAGLWVEFDMISGYLDQYYQNLPKGKWFIFLLSLTILLWAGFIFTIKSESVLARKIKNFTAEIKNGVFSIIRSRHKTAFFIQTFLIWFLYVLMLYVVMLAFDETKGLPSGAVLLSFVTGSLSIVLSNGGIGTYPVFVTETLLLYGVSKDGGFAFSLTMWSAQTLVLILFGIVSMMMLPAVNRKNANSQANA